MHICILCIYSTNNCITIGHKYSDKKGNSSSQTRNNLLNFQTLFQERTNNWLKQQVKLENFLP